MKARYGLYKFILGSTTSWIGFYWPLSGLARVLWIYNCDINNIMQHWRALCKTCYLLFQRGMKGRDMRGRMSPN